MEATCETDKTVEQLDGSRFVDRDAFEAHARKIESGEAIVTFEMLGDIFGKEFWMILVMSLMEAQSAARAIQLAISKTILIAEAEGRQRTAEVPRSPLVVP